MRGMGSGIKEFKDAMKEEDKKESTAAKIGRASCRERV